MIKDIAFTAYPAKDVKALREFYRDSLGLTFSGSYEEEGVLKYDEAKVGSGCFAVMTGDWLEIAPCAGLAFEVDNLDETIAALKNKGVAVEAIHDTPVCRLSSFRDPEGNKVTLHQTTVTH